VRPLLVAVPRLDAICPLTASGPFRTGTVPLDITTLGAIIPLVIRGTTRAPLDITTPGAITPLVFRGTTRARLEIITPGAIGPLLVRRATPVPSGNVAVAPLAGLVSTWVTTVAPLLVSSTPTGFGTGRPFRARRRPTLSAIWPPGAPACEIATGGAATAGLGTFRVGMRRALSR
jgi:hypothetical protein